MRFRLNPVIFSLLCAFAVDAVADSNLLMPEGQNAASPQAQVAQDTPTFVEADLLEGQKDNKLEATGNAVLRKDDQSISAERLLFSHETSDLDAQGSVVLNQDGNTMSGPHLHFNLETRAGKMETPTFYLPENKGRGSAEVMNFIDRTHFSLDQATYTTCPANNQDWQLKMSELELDRGQQIGIAHNARVEFMGVPVLYSPWMDFPISDQRKSGFLAPMFGGTTRGGSELTIPYYWNIAPNRDATIVPRVLTKRGLQLNNEFRYLEDNYDGELNLDVLPNDRVANRTRSQIGLMHNHNLAAGLQGSLNLNSVSDDNYFRDLSNSVSITSQANLLQEGSLSYDHDWWSAALRVQRYQTLQDPAAPIISPYKRLPQLTVGAINNLLGGQASFAGEFVDFSHPTLTNAKRLVINPSMSYPLIKESAFYLTPKLALHSTHYVMGANNLAALPNSSRTLPMLSVDSGLSLERDWDLFGGNYLHTLEPRAFYVYVPYKDQSLLPNFDSAQADFSFTQMFAENRFFGSDRIGDANQITLALTSRLLEQSNGMERLKVAIGERFSFKAPQVNLLTPTTSTNKSDILLAASGVVTDAWSLDSEFQMDPYQSHAQRYNLSARYRPEPGKVLNFGYRFARNALRQIDLSTQWPLSSRWHAVGRWNFSLQDSRILEGIAGLEYNQSCWTLRLVAQRFTVGAQQANTGLFLQLELSDLIKLGSDPLGLLKQSVPGYSKLNPTD